MKKVNVFMVLFSLMVTLGMSQSTPESLPAEKIYAFNVNFLVAKMVPGSVYFIPIAVIMVVLLINLIVGIVLIVIHKKRQPRDASEKDFDKVEVENEEEEPDENDQKKGEGKKSGIAGGKSGGQKGPKKQVPKKPAKPTEFKFDGQAPADTETLKYQTAEQQPQPGGQSGTKTDLQSVQTIK